MDLHGKELLTAGEVAWMLSISARMVLVMERAGELPAHVKLGSKTLRWRRRDIEAYLYNLKSEKPTSKSK
jgi:predicted DNA-binding transcriptional regulator AlpA